MPTRDSLDRAVSRIMIWYIPVVLSPVPLVYFLRSRAILGMVIVFAVLLAAHGLAIGLAWNLPDVTDESRKRNGPLSDWLVLVFLLALTALRRNTQALHMSIIGLAGLIATKYAFFLLGRAITRRRQTHNS